MPQAEHLDLQQFRCPHCRNTILILGEDGWVAELYDHTLTCPFCDATWGPADLAEVDHRCGALPTGKIALTVQTARIVHIWDDAKPFPYPDAALMAARKQFYHSKNLTKGDSWRRLSRQQLRQQLLDKFIEWLGSGRPDELLDVINQAAIAYVRYTEGP